jgi:hypothetical protein
MIFNTDHPSLNIIDLTTGLEHTAALFFQVFLALMLGRFVCDLVFVVQFAFYVQRWAGGLTTIPRVLCWRPAWSTVSRQICYDFMGRYDATSEE